MQIKTPLPIDPFLSEISDAVRDHSTILVKASPGSGKTTRLPWALVKNLKARVVVLEPRRIAAKLAAQRIADEENLTLGQEVGHHFRFEKNITDSTSLIFYTEGTFLKKFLSDPDLKGIDIVILDEFHERHLDTDLALALLRDLQGRRPGLKIIIMSATLDTRMLDDFPDSKTIEIEGVNYPVEISYLPNTPSVLNQSLEAKVKKAIESVLNKPGDILVFLPGMREMLRTQEALSGSFEVLLLHADLTKEEQSRALGPSSQRKIILATNIAESSVTIPGIRIVIDSGIQREAHFSPWNGLRFIEDSPVTKSSAIQRAGRAGRTAPGECLRLYSQQDYNERQEHTVPEIFRADLTDVFLLIKGTGLTPHWFHPPTKDKWEKAQELCTRLGAIDEEGKITSVGKKMLELPLSARLSRILLSGEKLPQKSKERLLRFICEDIENDRSGMLYRRLQFYTKNAGADETPWERCLLDGFVDQVARFRQKQRDFIHYSGKTIKAHHSLENLHDDFYVILDITGRQEAIKVFPVEEEWFWEMDPFPFSEEEEVEVGEKILLKRKTKLGSIVIEETPVKLVWSELNQTVKSRISDLSRSTFLFELQKFKETPVFERLHYWAKKKGHDIEKIEESLSALGLFDYAQELSWDSVQNYFQSEIETKLDVGNLDRELPLKINLGGKRELVIHYPMGMDPYLEAPIQDFYGLNDTPSIMQGQVPLTLKLLGPHKRPIQVTKDLKNFWAKTYQEMKKEYQRDYPRHYWPDKPWEAKPFLLKSHLPKA